FQKSKWELDNRTGDPYANRYLASMLGFARLADQAGDATAASAARDQAAVTAEGLVAWWERTVQEPAFGSFTNTTQLDAFINHGDKLFLALAPHRHQLALWQDLTPGIARGLRERIPMVLEAVWQRFAALCPTWPFAGAEPQVHFGENFVDTPDFALDAFRARAWLSDAPPAELAEDLDLPRCPADLDYVIKLAIILER
ncbi:MAG: hypothetical protein KGS61_10265, partial [Verrucomicrobia bacterium]|nr:hypothetical protein [Verrucomicrobiota bacterium]